MAEIKLKAGDRFPEIVVNKIGGGNLTLGTPTNGYDGQLVVVYRGKHCPLCTRYLDELNTALSELNDIGIDVVAVSADPVKKAEEQIGQINPDYAVGYDLSIEQMRVLGLYISNPRSNEETDRPFAEPGIFFVNKETRLQVVDISNAQLARPELKTLIMGLAFICNPENNYPIRGTYEEN